MVEVLVGLDIGTSTCKVGVVSTDGEELADARTPTPWRMVPSGAELDPDDLLRAVWSSLGEALDRVPGTRVVGLGVASQAEAGFLVGADGSVLAPAIAWFDSRGSLEAATLAERLGQDAFASTTGLPLTALCSLSKYLWLRKARPDQDMAGRWLSLAEWAVHEMGGEAVTELSLASRTGFLDLLQRREWDDALEAAGARAPLLGELVWAGTDLGRVRNGDARLRGALLTVAGMDHLASAVGAGVVDDTAILDSCGTAEGFVLARRPPIATSEVRSSVATGITVGWHVVQGHLAYLGALRSGAVLRRTLDLLGCSEDDVEAAAETDADAPSRDSATARPPVAAPTRPVVAIKGDDPASIEILDPGRPQAVWREVVEAIADEGTATIARLERAAGLRPEGALRSVIACGGWIRSPTARAAKRARLGEAFAVAPVTEAGTRGAALLSGVAAGLYPSIEAIPMPG